MVITISLLLLIALSLFLYMENRKLAARNEQIRTENQRLAAENECARDSDKISFVLGKWGDNGEYLRTTNPLYFDFMSPLSPYYAIVESKGRDVKDGTEVIRLSARAYGEREISRVIYRYQGKELEASQPDFNLELSGDQEQEIDVELELHFDDDTIKKHSFRIWYFPLQEFCNRDLQVPCFSRVVLEKSSIPFVAPMQKHTLEWWAKVTSEQQILLNELAQEISEDIPQAWSRRKRVEQVIRLLNIRVWKGFSNLDVTAITPLELYRFGSQENRLVHVHFNYLATVMMHSMGITARMVLKEEIGGDNIALEGSAYVVEYYDLETEKFVICSPWLSVVRVETPKGDLLSTFDVIQLQRMGLLEDMVVVAYDPLNDELLSLSKNNSRSYDAFRKGFDRLYPLDFHGVLEHIDHYTKNGDMSFKPVRVLLQEYYRQPIYPRPA
jgi:hypothetical protein